MKDCPSSFKLHRYLIENDDQVIADHLGQCPVCAAIADTFRGEQAAFYRIHPTRQILDRFTEQAEPGWKGFLERWRISFPLPLATYATVFTLVLSFLGLAVFILDLDDQRPEIRYKGSVEQFGYYLKSGNVYKPAGANIHRSGDEIRLYYQTNRHFIMVVSIEESGRINLFHADAEGNSLQVADDQLGYFDRKIILDGYIGVEHFLMICSDEKMSFDHVKGMLKQLSNLGDIPGNLGEKMDISIKHFTIVKR